jgi:hypothetical protein
MTRIGHYQAFGLDILSDIPLQLPPFPTTSLHDAVHERVWITHGSVCKDFKLEHWAGLIEYGFSGDHEKTLLHLPGFVDISIDRDNRVVVEPAHGSEEMVIAQVITSLVLILILKRKQLVTVHGSAVSSEAHAIVLMGDRGSGKSTTAAALAGQGYHMMCDDIVPIGLDRNGTTEAIVFPGIPRPKLLHETYQEFFAGSWDMNHLFDGIDKYQVPIETHIGSFPLRLVCILREDPRCDELKYRRLQGSEKIARIMQHVSVLDGIESRQDAFMHALAIFQDIAVHEIVRPKGISTVSQVVSLIETLFQHA